MATITARRDIREIDPLWDSRTEEDKSAIEAGALSCPGRTMQCWGLPSHWRKAGPFDWTGCEEVVVLPGRLSGVPTVGESRFSADNLLALYESGMSARELASGYLLDLQKVVTVLSFAIAHGAQENKTEALRGVQEELTSNGLSARLRTPVVDWSGCRLVLSSDINAGNPTVAGSSVLADAIVEEFDSGGSVQQIASLYRLASSTVDGLLLFAGRQRKDAAA